MSYIKTFKVIESHYNWKYATCQYLPEELNIKEMYHLYTKHCHENGFAVENCDFYKWIFTKRFCLRFQKPKKDICHYCTSYKNLTEVTEGREKVP